MTGQDAVATARAFHEALALDGVILTKLDGDARGGAALSVKEVVGRPIVFASTGERLADFDLFHPDRMASRILGMGDVLTLIEQAERDDGPRGRGALGRPAPRRAASPSTTSSTSSSRSRRWARSAGILRLMPGMPKELRQAADQIDDSQVAQVEAIIRSMTRHERADPASSTARAASASPGGAAPPPRR